jgi:hypothetical protein
MKGFVLVPLAAAENHCTYKAVREENIEAWDHQQKQAPI